MRIGDLDVVPLSDGTYRMAQDFYVGLDFAAHPEMLADDGRVPIPIGCFLVRGAGRIVLVDAGVGRIQAGAWGHGGQLPAGLASAGVAPADIDTVVCTHLHIDHIGWLVDDGKPYFPNATVRYGSGDWAPFVESPDERDRGRHIMETLQDAGRLEPIDADMTAICPGITARHTPGHTPGHYGLVLSSGAERAYVLGDAVECPLQLSEPEFHALSDVDPSLAARTRETLWRELEGSPTVMTGAHFPGLAFGRVVTTSGRRWFAPID